MTLLGFGAAYGTAKSAVAISAISPTKPDLIMKSILPVIMAGIIAIYGVVIAVIIINDMKKRGNNYTDYQ